MLNNDLTVQAIGEKNSFPVAKTESGEIKERLVQLEQEILTMKEKIKELELKK